MIVVANYKGPDGHDLSQQLVYQLRSKHNLPAYVWNIADKKRAEMKAEEEQWKRQNPQLPFKRWRIDEEYGVLIGGFDSMDSAREYMNKVIKKLPPPPLKLPGGKSAYDTMLLAKPDVNGKMEVKQTTVNPLTSSFVSRNPTLGSTAKKADPFLKELNEGEEYSLLKCPQPFTLAVKVYGGGSVVVTQTDDRSAARTFLDKLWGSESHAGDALLASAKTAHEAARALRQFKFDAYVLHTRTASIVTVGGFKDANDPAIERTMQQLKERELDVRMQLIAAPYEVPRP